ncbi:MAG: MFS transporter [Deltaproteobacteria bacterium]|nr:MFS transporter [Deltaproteobacteria bacterium]
MTDSSRKLPRTVWLFGLASFFTDIGSEMIVGLLPVFMVGTLHASGTMVGLVDGVADATSAVLKLFAGQISDRARRRKPLVLLGYGISTLVRPLVSFAVSPWQAIVVRGVDRVGKGIRGAPRDALLVDLVEGQGPEVAARAFGVNRALDHAGAVVGPLLASGLLWIGFTMPEVFRVAWIPGALALLCLVLVREKAREPPASSSSSWVPVAPPRGLARALPPFAIVAMALAIEPFLLLIARERGVADPLLPLVWLVLHVGKSSAAALVPTPSSSSSRQRWLLASWATAAVGLLACSLAPGVPLLIAGVVVTGLGSGAREPLERARVAELAGPGRGGAFGWFHLVTGLAALPGGLGLGLLWDQTDPMTTSLAASALLVIAMAWSAIDARRHVESTPPM